MRGDGRVKMAWREEDAGRCRRKKTAKANVMEEGASFGNVRKTKRRGFEVREGNRG